MAATELLASRERAPDQQRATSFTTNDDITFPYAFPRDGEYRLWVQFRLDAKVRTGVFDVHVAPGP
jgi:hypothetical protein